MFKTRMFIFIFLLCGVAAKASFLLLPMDDTTQRNHLKAYGITYWAIDKQYKVNWLLNYRGGSFLISDAPEIRRECQIRGVSFEILSDGQTQTILNEIASPSQNMESVALEKAPKVAVYTPDGKMPWDDAVTLVLTYAEIPYDVVYDEEIKGNIYCLTGIYSEELRGERNDIFLDTHAFGEDLIEINHPKIFLQRVMDGLRKLGYKNIIHEKVTYYDNNYSGELGFFKKHEKFKGQNEFRIFVPNKDNKPIKLNIGSLKDIASISKNGFREVHYGDGKIQNITY